MGKRRDYRNHPEAEQLLRTGLYLLGTSAIIWSTTEEGQEIVAEKKGEVQPRIMLHKHGKFFEKASTISQQNNSY